MARHRRRGRPALHRPEQDHGTPELQGKRRLNLTTEPLDLLLQQERISEAQHRIGIRLRWLYTLRYGLPTVQAHDPAQPAGVAHRANAEDWQSEREREWHEAVNALKRSGCHALTLALCVYQNITFSQLNESTLDRLRIGLDTVRLAWNRYNATQLSSKDHFCHR